MQNLAKITFVQSSSVLSRASEEIHKRRYLMTFGMVVEALREGKKIRRKAWRTQWFSSAVSMETGRVCLYLDEILADDWEVVNE